MPGDKAKRNYEGDGSPKQDGTQDPRMSLEQHRAKFNQRIQWQRDSNQRDAERLAGKHTNFDDDGETTITRGSVISQNEIAAYKIQSGQIIDYYDEKDWKSSGTRQEIRTVLNIVKDNVEHKEFSAIHHTLPKSILEHSNITMFTDNQRENLGKMLGIQLNEVNQALSNLYSNLSVGPNTKYRVDDPETGLDATYYQVEGKEHSYQRMDPISAEYQELYKILGEIGQKGTLSDGQFNNISKCLERAEKIHVVLTGGYRINPEVSMWKRSDDNRWEKVPIPISEEEWSTKQLLIDSYVRDDISLSDLKRIFPS